MVDAARVVPEDGRVYLRLQDGRGWVCERSRNNFSWYAVEPMKPDDPQLPSPKDEVSEMRSDADLFSPSAHLSIEKQVCVAFEAIRRLAAYHEHKIKDGTIESEKHLREVHRRAVLFAPVCEGKKVAQADEE